MRKTVIITVIVVVLTSLGLTLFVRMTTVNNSELMSLAVVKNGDFEISVSKSGEAASSIIKEGFIFYGFLSRRPKYVT